MTDQTELFVDPEPIEPENQEEVQAREFNFKRGSVWKRLTITDRLTIDNFKDRMGFRFRMTRAQKHGGISREEALEQWIAANSRPVRSV